MVVNALWKMKQEMRYEIIRMWDREKWLADDIWVIRAIDAATGQRLIVS